MDAREAAGRRQEAARRRRSLSTKPKLYFVALMWLDVIGSGCWLDHASL
jgi:hypothetical protein